MINQLIKQKQKKSGQLTRLFVDKDKEKACMPEAIKRLQFNLKYIKVYNKKYKLNGVDFEVDLSSMCTEGARQRTL